MFGELGKNRGESTHGFGNAGQNVCVLSSTYTRPGTGSRDDANAQRGSTLAPNAPTLPPRTQLQTGRRRAQYFTTARRTPNRANTTTGKKKKRKTWARKPKCFRKRRKHFSFSGKWRRDLSRDPPRDTSYVLFTSRERLWTYNFERHFALKRTTTRRYVPDSVRCNVQCSGSGWSL